MTRTVDHALQAIVNICLAPVFSLAVFHDKTLTEAVARLLYVSVICAAVIEVRRWCGSSREATP